MRIWVALGSFLTRIAVTLIALRDCCARAGLSNSQNIARDTKNVDDNLQHVDGRPKSSDFWSAVNVLGFDFNAIGFMFTAGRPFY
jgi:hypothetical protein